jgi:hypothetical protein
MFRSHFLGEFAKLEKRVFALSCLCSSVRPSAWNNSAPVGRIFIYFDIRGLFENLSRKFTFD